MKKEVFEETPLTGIPYTKPAPLFSPKGHDCMGVMRDPQQNYGYEFMLIHDWMI